MKCYENECGLFYADRNGRLLRFVPRRRVRCWDGSLLFLQIPEGIRALGPGAFAGYRMNRLYLPSTLEELGDRAFSGTYFGSIEFLGGKPSPAVLRRLAHLLRFTFSWDGEKLMEKWGREYLDIYRGREENPNCWKTLSSPSGDFFVDSDGMLMDYRIRTQKDKQNRETIGRLEIPEGVQGISDEMFRRLRIEEELILPQSLRYVGNCSFADCDISKLILPDRLEVLDCYAFGGCRIGTLTMGQEFGGKLLPQGARQFKDCRVAEYRVPAERRGVLANYHEKDGFIIRETVDPCLGKLYCVQDPRAEMGWGNDAMNVILGFTR